MKSYEEMYQEFQILSKEVEDNMERKALQMAEYEREAEQLRKEVEVRRTEQINILIQQDIDRQIEMNNLMFQLF